MSEETLPYWRQHYTARTYLKSWAIEPFVKGKEKVRAFQVTGQCQWEDSQEKPVGDIAWEPDLYSLYGSDGARNTDYEEHVFGETERDFGQLKLLFGTPEKLLAPGKRKTLARFAAYQVLKVPVMFGSYRALIQALVDGLDQRGLSQSNLVALGLVNKEGVKTDHSIAEARLYLQGNGFEHFSVPRLKILHSVVKRMKLLLFTFDSGDALITSTVPALLRLMHYGAHWTPIEDKNSQLIMPLTPRLLAVLNWQEEGVKRGDEERAIGANTLQLRNARGMLIGTKNMIDPEILRVALAAPEATQFAGFRGHLDPVPESIRRASPQYLEASGPGVETKLMEVWPDGTTVEVPTVGRQPPSA